MWISEPRDGPLTLGKTHQSSTPTLDSVSEHVDTPSSTPRDAAHESPAPKQPTPKQPTPRQHTPRQPTPKKSTPRDPTPKKPFREPATPTTTKIRPPMSAMHPSKAQSTMAPPSEGLRLGFTDIRPVAKRDGGLPSGVAQHTPTKASAVPSTPFTFSVGRPSADPNLSSRAKLMMAELRGEADRIKAELAAQREKQGGVDLGGRVIAQPKGKTGRYSAAHEAAFEKMDSIANHPSAFRAKLTPVAGVKRSSSRADLDELPPSVTKRSAMKRSPSKARLDDVAPRSPWLRKALASSVKSRAAAIDTSESAPLASTPAKRAKQRVEDDASSSRPISRDGSSIPRPESSGNDSGATLRHSKSTMSLISPAKASLSRTASKGPGATASPSTSELPTLKRSATTASLKGALTPGRRLLTPSRFERVKSILKTRRDDTEKPGSALPLPAAPVSKTPAPPRVDKALPPLPMCATTPRRKPIRNLDSTPSESEAVKMQNSPSPVKKQTSPTRGPTSLFKSLSRSVRGVDAEANYQNMDSVLGSSAKKNTEAKKADKKDEVVYPDLSVFSGLAGGKEKSASVPPPSAPGTFTFRSDHTINFSGASPTGFGASPGQSSIRQVRNSVLPAPSIPGSFPDTSSTSASTSASDPARTADARSSNKENRSPALKLQGISHGMQSKKRHRPSTDEEDARREAEERAVKKRKNEHVPEGDALMAPRLMGRTTAPGGSGNGRGGLKLDSPAKKTMVPRAGVQAASRTPGKKPVLSMSRLNMLATPKKRV